jgi:hypothetical protein
LVVIAGGSFSPPTSPSLPLPLAAVPEGFVFRSNSHSDVKQLTPRASI